MDLKLQRQAQQRADRIAAFRAELAQIEDEGGLALAPEQRIRLETHLNGLLEKFRQQFGVDVSEPSRQVSWGMRIASLLGAAALFAAVILFFHRIWGMIPLWGQIGILTAVPLVLLIATEFSFRRSGASYYVSLLAIATGAAFVVELNALGAILNLRESPHALLAWAAAAILLAYAYGPRLLLGAGLTLACGYLCCLLVQWEGGYWIHWDSRTQYLLPGAFILYITPWLVRHRPDYDFDIVYRLTGAFVGLLALLILSKSADLCCAPSAAQLAEVLSQLAGLALSAAIVFHGLRLGRGVLANLGVVGFMVFLFARLHDWWWDWMPKYLFFLIIGLVFISLMLVFWYLRRRWYGRGIS